MYIYRNLDGVYFRVNREGKWKSVCFSDLTDAEQDEVMQGKNEEWLKSLCKVLAMSISQIGSQLDIVRE